MAAARATSPRPAARIRRVSTSRCGFAANRGATAHCVSEAAAERPERDVGALGIDPGSKRIGVAVSDRSGTIASPLIVLERAGSRQHDDAEIARIVREEEVEVVVVGLPVNMDGSHGASAKAAIADARRLATVVGVPIELHDERRTTVSADRSMRGAESRRGRAPAAGRQGGGRDHAPVVARRGERAG